MFAWAKSDHLLKSSLLQNEKVISVNLKSKGDTPYIVQTGDTVESVALKHHMTAKELKANNKNLPKGVGLSAGSTLQIPNQTIDLSILLGAWASAGPLLQEARKHLGKTYVWSAAGPAHFDCSGFTSYVLKQNGIQIPRTSIQQGQTGELIVRDSLRKGDLIFFDTSKEKNGTIDHVGIYLGDGKFIHASSATMSVVVSSLDQNFYQSRFLWGRRVNS